MEAPLKYVPMTNLGLELSPVLKVQEIVDRQKQIAYGYGRT
jgi:hypothetical protein